jgi:anti-sigma factor RsiW
MIFDDLTCERARERLSARLDGELADGGGLTAHLGRCAPCRAHERELERLTRGFAALRDEHQPLRDLWPGIASRARRRPATRVLARVAAALVGFLGVGSAARLLDPDPTATPDRHLLERLGPLERPSTLFAALPEYRVLRAFPPAEEPR